MRPGTKAALMRLREKGQRMKTSKLAARATDWPGGNRRRRTWFWWWRAVPGLGLSLATASADPCYEPSQDVPPPDSSYTGPFHAQWANGWTIVGDISEHANFGGTNAPPPPPNTTQTHQFPSTVTLGLSTDGGASFHCLTAPAQTTVSLSHTNDNGCTNFYGTEMLQLDISGGGLPAGAMIRQSPTRRSLGQLTVQPAAGGGYLMSSFFDIWPELSLDNGVTWSPATNAAHVALTNKSPELFSTTDGLPPLSATYSSPPGRVTVFCTNGICCTKGFIITNIVHRAFSANQPAPPLGSNAIHSFSSQLDFQISFDGGTTFLQQHAPANVSVLVNHTQDLEGAQFFDTRMLQLDVQGGTLPPPLRLRASLTQPSLGKTHIRPVPGGFMVSSWFDINTELSTDSGATWTAACCPERMALTLTNYPMTVQSLNPVGYWRLNETTQPPASLTATNLGALGAAGDGSYMGGTPGVRGALAGSADTAARFNGAVVIPFSPPLSLSGPFTVEAWLMAASTTTGTPCPLSCGTFGANRSGCLIYQNANSGWNFRMYNGVGANTAVNINAGGPTVPGIWYHVAAVYNGTAAVLYVNGIGQTAPFTGPFSPNANGPLTIGMRSDTNFLWPGSVDEVAIYPLPLSPIDIMSHYQNGTNNTPPIPYDQLVQSRNPLIYLRLDEPNPLPVAFNIGLVGTNANGQFEFGSLPGLPGVPFVGLGPNNYGTEFNGLNGYVDIPSSNLNLTGPLTITVWTLPAPGNGLFQTIVGKGDTSYRLDMDFNGYPHFADGQANPDIVGPTPIDDGQWHLLAGVYDGLSENSLYVDGLLAGTGPATNPVTGSPFDLWLGGAPDYGPVRLFNGLVDEVTVLSNALTAPQIQQMYNSAFAGGTPGPGVANINIRFTNAPNTQVQLIWPCGVLQSATQATGPYADMLNTPSPYTMAPTNGNHFYRVRK